VTVKAAVYQGPFKLAVENVEDTNIEQPGDAIIRITTANICGRLRHRVYQGHHHRLGPVPVMRYNRWLRDLIIRGQAKPSQIISQELPLDEAVRAYDQFDKRAEGRTKVILHRARSPDPALW
jgi:threonine dehydrogenase-like Zn-dependent dehydrogenase